MAIRTRSIVLSTLIVSVVGYPDNKSADERIIVKNPSAGESKRIQLIIRHSHNIAIIDDFSL
ncbi:hypothetical protein ACOJIV_27115, partial [Haloarcula sp. AONF1]